jgi:hypothetical protein
MKATLFFLAFGICFAQPQNVLVLPHYAIGAEWQSVIRVSNPSESAQPVIVRFFGIHGQRQPVTLAGYGTVDNVSRTVPAHGIWELQPSTDSGLLIHGAVTVQRQSADVAASVLFQSRVPGRPDFEAGVPAVLPGEKFVVSFDNTAGHTTSFALQNLEASSNLINVAIYDENGVKLSVPGFIGFLDLPANDRLIFGMPERWPVTAGRKGTVVFDNLRVFAVMGLLFNAGGAFTALTPF